MVSLARRNAANRLESTLSGAKLHADAASLAALAGELRELALLAPTLGPTEASRAELLATVARGRSAPPARKGGRVRGASLAIAAVAGAGLVVAGAAGGPNPATLVADVARDLPGLAGRSAPPVSVSIEGEVIATRDHGRTLEVRTGATTVVIEAPGRARDITAEGTPFASSMITAGDTVRVTTERAPDAGRIPATRIELLPPSTLTSPAPTVGPAAAAPATKEPTVDSRPATVHVTAVAKETPTAPPTRTPTAGPSVNATSVSTTPIVVGTALPPEPKTPAPTATPTPKPPPVRTPAEGTGTGVVEKDETSGLNIANPEGANASN
jgi:hypothetical protein